MYVLTCDVYVLSPAPWLQAIHAAGAQGQQPVGAWHAEAGAHKAGASTARLWSSPGQPGTRAAGEQRCFVCSCVVDLSYWLVWILRDDVGANSSR
jgi:hypothetical protein